MRASSSPDLFPGGEDRVLHALEFLAFGERELARLSHRGDGLLTGGGFLENGHGLALGESALFHRSISQRRYDRQDDHGCDEMRKAASTGFHDG
jgi:hypothetical protein